MGNERSSLILEKRHRLAGSGRGFSNRLGDILRPGKRTADVDAGFRRLHRGEALRLGKAVRVQIDPELGRHLTYLGGRSHTGGEHDHIKLFRCDITVIILVRNLQIFRGGNFFDGRGVAADVAHAELFGPLVIGVESFPVSAHVDEENRAIQIGRMLFGDNRLFGGIHAADRGTVVPLDFSRADALDPRDALRVFLIGGPKDFAQIRAAGGQQPLELHAGQDVGIPVETELFLQIRFEMFVSRRQDHGADVHLLDFVLLLVVNRLGLTEVLTRPTHLFEEVHARIAVDHGDLRDRLREGDVNRRARRQGHVILGQDRAGLFQRDLGQVHDLHRANHFAGAAGDTNGRVLVVRDGDFPIRTSAGKTNRSHSHSFLTHPGTQSAEDTILVLFGKTRLSDAHLLGHVLQYHRIRAPRQQQFQHDPAGL